MSQVIRTLAHRPKKRSRKAPAWRVEPVRHERFPELPKLGRGELLAILASAHSRLRALEAEVAALRSGQ